MEDSHFDVSIVMPCLDEMQTIGMCIEEAQSALIIMHQRYGYKGEVVIADNGSVDDSIAIAEELGARVVNISHKGYGNALIGGIKNAYGRFIVMGDSDHSYNFHETVPMVEKLEEGYQLCMGSRFKGTIMPGAMSWKNQYIGNPILSGILNLLFNTGLSDAHCGIRAFTKEAFELMHLTSSGMEFASEMVIKATLVDLSRTEVPVTLRPDGRDRPPHLRPWRDGWRHLRYIFMLSPSWLFFIPSTIFGTIGIIVFLALILNPNTEMIHIGPFEFGDHWMVIGGMLMVISHQTLIFGLTTSLYGISEGYRRAGRWLKTIFRVINLESMMLIGLFTLVIGMLMLIAVFSEWSGAGFGGLNKIREVFGGSMLVLIGLQNFFGGFLLSIVGGNEASFYTESGIVK
jgi:glycosyltransferase involved in cell wall biosynthesis